MTKKFFLLIVAILMGGMTAVKAKINYVPLYIVDTTPDVTEPRRTPAGPLFITQDDHKLTLPEIDDSLTLKVLKDNQFVYIKDLKRHQLAVTLPATLVGDYEIRLCADTYYYFGYITLESHEEPDIPSENANWENITLLGSNTSQEVILDYIMGLNVVEYNVKMPEDLCYLNQENNEAYINQWEEMHETRRFGLLPEELSAIFPQLVVYYENGEFGINYMDLIPILISCIQELKVQLDNRTEALVNVMMSQDLTPTVYHSVRAAIGNTLLSAAPTSVSESATIRYLLTDNVFNAYITITDMGGRVVTKVPVSPSDTSATIDSGTLGEGIFLCTLYANGENIGTKRLIKTK